MAKCAVCGKSVHFGNKVESCAHRRSNKMWKPNIKSVRVRVNGGTKKKCQYVQDVYVLEL